MKKKIFIALSLSMFITACNLDEELRDSLSGEQANNVRTAQQSLDYTYNLLQDLNNLDNTWSLQEHPSDECAGPTRGNDWDDGGAWRALHYQTWTADHVRVISSYDVLHKGLAYAVATLGISDITASQKAQATFLKVFYMWNITDLFGQVTMREPNESTPVASIYLTRAESIDKEISLLEAEIANLPDGTAQNAWIANKNAGYALLAKLYLNRAVYKATDADGKPQAGPFTFNITDMDKVIDYCDLAMEGRSLATNYFDNFAPKNADISTELIFTQQNTHAYSPNIWKNANMTLHYNQNPSGWNGFVTLTDLYNKFLAGDQRLSSSYTGLTDVSGLKAGILVGQQKDQNGTNILTRQGTNLSFTTDFSLTNSTEEKGMRVIKYMPDYASSSLQLAENDWVFIRLADVMLMKAEALARKGDLATAKSLVNEIRAARSTSDLASVGLQEILDERGRELYWEGHRRTDQIRFSTFLDPVQERSGTTDRHVIVYPIPLVPLGANPNLHQNPGY